MDRNTGKRCVQEGKHRNAIQNTDRNRNLETGTKLEMVILSRLLVIPEFERRN